MSRRIEDLPVEVRSGDLETRYAEWGDVAVRHLRVPPGTDFGPVLAGLPGDRCPSPHWGYVIEGSIDLVHADGREEHVAAGEVYSWPAGHTGRSDEGVVFVEFGPLGPMRQFSEHARALVGVDAAG